MVKRYLVTGNWIDKESGKPKSGIAEVTSGVSKNGHYEMVNTDSREKPIDGTYPVGTILTANVELAVQEKENAGKPTLKIGQS